MGTGFNTLCFIINLIEILRGHQAIGQMVRMIE